MLTPKAVHTFMISCRAAVAAVLALGLYKLTTLPDAGWAAVSAVVVMQPTLHTSMRASMLRVGSNFIGALSGAVLIGAFGVNFLSLSLAIVVTGVACHYAKLEEALRSAFVSVVIVTLSTAGNRWEAPLHRLVAVLIGCSVAVAVSLCFDQIANLAGSETKTEDSE